MTLIVRELDVSDESAFLRGFREWEEEDLSWYTFEFKFNDHFEDHIKRLKKNKAGIDLDPRFVPSTMLYAFLDGEIVGRVSIRHTLNDYLKNIGGHIGYAVAPRFRNQGIGEALLRSGLKYCREELRLEKVLVTCDEANIGSSKIIDKCGGVLENKMIDPESKNVKNRYWINL